MTIRIPCHYCHAPVRLTAGIRGGGEADHFPIPRRHGGTVVVPACLVCHDMKDRLLIESWRPGVFDTGFRALCGSVFPPGMLTVRVGGHAANRTVPYVLACVMVSLPTVQKAWRSVAWEARISYAKMLNRAQDYFADDPDSDDPDDGMAAMARSAWEYFGALTEKPIDSPAVMAAVGRNCADVIGERTKDALAARKAAGMVLGRPATLPDETVRHIVAERAAGKSLNAIVDGLNAAGVPTARGGPWGKSSVQGVLASERVLSGRVAS